MPAPILRTEDVPTEPTLVDVVYGLPDFSQGTVRVNRAMLEAQNRPKLQALVDHSAQVMLKLRADLKVD